MQRRSAKNRRSNARTPVENAPTRPPGTEFLDAETGPQISPPKWVSAHRDKNPGNEWSEIPAETPYLVSSQNRAVCGDRMVGCAVICEPVSKGPKSHNREKYREKREYMRKLAIRFSKAQYP